MHFGYAGVPVLLMVELGVASKVAAIAVPCLSSKSLSLSAALTVTRICSAS